MRGKAFWTILIILVAVVVIYFAVGDMPGSQNGDASPVSVENDFGTKVVYTTDMSVDTEPLMADCDLRGGQFNECGSVCEPSADICTQQCAYTCDNISESDSNSTSTDMEDDETSTTSATSTN